MNKQWFSVICRQIHQELYKERMDWLQEKWIVLIKPDCMNKIIDGIWFPDIITDLFSVLNLDIEQEGEKMLTHEDLYDLFPPLSKPCDYWWHWKPLFIQHMTAEKVKYYLLNWEKTNEKIYLLKQKIRKELVDILSWENKVVYNLLHTVDREDFEKSYDVLFADKKWK